MPLGRETLFLRHRQEPQQGFGVTAGLIGDLRSPRSGRRLVLDGDALMSGDGLERFPVVDGIPVLIDDERSPFSTAAFLEPRTSRPLVQWLRRTARLLVPSVSQNLASEANFRRLAELLGSGATRPRVLVVGGSVVGEGFETMLEGDRFDLVETDVAFGPRTSIICDGHALPFRDAAFDAVICQAVLEHVADPPQVVSEMHRVLKAGGLVYSEIPFMQQVHEGLNDFTRYTLVGHRRLYRRFEAIEMGATGGPGMMLAWSLRYFFATLGGRSTAARQALGLIAGSLFFWLKYLDRVMLRSPAAMDSASGTFFLGRSQAQPISDHDVMGEFGASGAGFRRERG